MSKIVIPTAGKLIHIKVKRYGKVLCFVLNRGYIESKTLQDMLCLEQILDKVDSVNYVGKINKVVLNNGATVYRHRLYFTSLATIVKVCKDNNIEFLLGNSFSIDSNHLMNCTDDLNILSQYARRHNKTINEWLTDTCKIAIYELLKEIGLTSKSLTSDSIKEIINGKVGYLTRAPLLVTDYIPKTHKAVFMMPISLQNEKLYDLKSSEVSILDIGYTSKGVKHDIKRRDLYV